MGAQRYEPQDYGFFGPDSVTWKVWSYPTSLTVGFQRAVVIEELDPFLVAAVDATSKIYSQPRVRYDRTLQYFATVAFGDTHTAVKSSQVLMKIHSKANGIEPRSGKRYDANDPAQQLWIHLTAWHSILYAYEVYGPGKLSPEEETQYWQECAVAAQLQTCDPADVPQTREGIVRYFEEKRPELAATDMTKRAMRHLLRADVMFPPVPAIYKPLALIISFVLRAATLATMPRWQLEMAGIRQPRFVGAVVRPIMRTTFWLTSRSVGFQLLALRFISPRTVPLVEPVLRKTRPAHMTTRNSPDAITTERNHGGEDVDFARGAWGYAEEPAPPTDEVGVALRDSYFSPLAMLATALGFALFIASDHVSSFFAWAPRSPLTAACMGGFYLAAGALFWRAVSGTSWVQVRLAAITPLVQISLIAVTTISASGELATNSGASLPQGAAAIWQVFHYLAPFVLVAVLVTQLRKGVIAEARFALLPSWVRIALGLHGLALAAVGTALLFSSDLATHWIGWPVNTLDARVIAAWLVTFGITEVLAGWEGDAQRIEGGMWALLVAGVAGLVIFVRYAKTLAGAGLHQDLLHSLTTAASPSHPQSLAFLVLAGSWLAMALAGFALSLVARPEPPRARRHAPNNAVEQVSASSI